MRSFTQRATLLPDSPTITLASLMPRRSSSRCPRVRRGRTEPKGPGRHRGSPTSRCELAVMLRNASSPAGNATSAARLSLRLTPHGHLLLEPADDAPELDEALAERIDAAFARGAGFGLLQLGASEIGESLSPVFAWWREFAARYVGMRRTGERDPRMEQHECRRSRSLQPCRKPQRCRHAVRVHRNVFDSRDGSGQDAARTTRAGAARICRNG